MKTKKHIIISNYDDVRNPYYAGGGAHAIHTMAKRLAKKFAITVLTGKYPGSKNRTVDGVLYKRIGVTFANPKIDQVLFIFVLPWYVLTMNFDIWFESFTPPISTACLQLFTKKPVIGFVHMLSSEDMERKYKLPFHLIEEIGLKTYKQFIVLSEGTKKKIRKFNKTAEVAVIPNGIDLPRTNSSRFKKKYILFLGRIEVNQKGIDLLIEAYRKIYKKIPYKLVIAGTGEKKQLDILDNILQNVGMKNHVILAGHVSGTKKSELLKQSVCLIVPSRFETFSITALEGMAFELPLITFDIDGLKWIPDSCRLKTKKFNVEKLAENILLISKKKNMQEKMKRSSKEFAKNFTWDNVTRRFENYISTLV